MEIEPFVPTLFPGLELAEDLVGYAVSAAENAREGARAAAEAALDGLTVAGEFVLHTGALATSEVADFFTMGPELLDLRARSIAANEGPARERRHDTPEKAKEFRDLSLAIYDSGEPVPDGYVEVEDAEERLGVPLKDEETGLEARVYYNAEEDLYVLVFEGTTSDDGGVDWGANLSNGIGGVPKQYRQALDIALRFQEVYGAEGDTVVTGHSLGGGLATFAGLGAGIETYTYNPSGLGPGTRLFLDSMGAVERNDDLVNNYVQRGDVLDLLRMADFAAGTPLTPFLYSWTGHLITVGETEHVGEFGRDPITSHNDPQL